MPFWKTQYVPATKFIWAKGAKENFLKKTLRGLQQNSGYITQAQHKLVLVSTSANRESLYFVA